ncbi:hypothetical protein ACIBG8_46820 [Nonomuraea sp. NPDC050556]|uniref:hypothetical protein n=1 Tax=Nonomuraea sp. NPDC050556 TaxID=3364369 RepID=UPI0037A8A2E8
METGAESVGGATGLLTDRLLIQVEADKVSDALPLVEAGGSGIVVTGEEATYLASSAWRAELDEPLLIDRRRYAGKSRKLGTAKLSRPWMEAQRQLGVATLLTDSGYVGQGDEASLHAILEQTAELDGDATAVLPLHTSWLSPARIQLLISAVCAYDVPVALVLEHKSDPLGSRQAATGLARLLQQPMTSVSLLCTDVSGLGALSFGAQWAAVGVTSKLRHLYPTDSRGGGGGRPPARHALVAPLLSLMSVDRIAEGWAATHHDADLERDIWRCTCSTCGNRTMEWLATASAAELTAHTFQLLLDVREGLAQLQPNARQESWLCKCRDAIWRNEDLSHRSGLNWQVPRFLRAWCPA